MPDYHELSLADCGGRNHVSLGVSGADDDGQIHLRVLHIDPAAVEANLGGQVGGRVEIRRQNTVGGRGRISHVLARGQHRTERLQRQ